MLCLRRKWYTAKTMPEAPALPLRDIGILAHIDAGKTSLTERFLFVSGRIRSPGDIDEGTTVTDYLEVERERGITVKAAAAHLEWSRRLSGSERQFRINLIDTPGHVDFSSEVGRSLRALDGAIVLVCAVAGVQSRTEVLYRACVRRGVGRLVFINKMDRRGASFERALGDLVRALDQRAVAVQIPWGEGESFRGVVDLVDMKAYDFRSGGETSRPRAVPVPRELKEAAERSRSVLVEALAEGVAEVATDAVVETALLEDFVAGRPSPPERVRTALRSATISGRATPVLCGSAFSDGAAGLLLDAVADYLPAPAEAVRAEGKDPATGQSFSLGPEDPFSALVFKTTADSRFGRLSWIRVRSGSLSPGDKVLDAATGSLVRILNIFDIQADRLEGSGGARDGDIVALALGGSGNGAAAGNVGATGTTLCDPKRPLLYEPIGFDAPVVSVALEPRTRDDAERLRRGVASLADEDPSLHLREDPQTGRIELSGMGELHLEVAIERLSRDYGVRVGMGRPRVAYRESLAGSASATEDFDRDLGGERAKAVVSLRVEPSEAGSGFAFGVEPSLRVLPLLYEAARRGAEAALSIGPEAGFPLESVQVTLERLTLPGGQSSRPDKLALRAVEIAASLAAGAALRKAGTKVLEPVMRLDIEVPDPFLGAAAAAITGRGGRIESIDSGPDEGRVISGAAPLRCLFGFASELRSCTEGRGEYAARFARFEPVPSGFSDFG
jgi:elongation factor G